MKELKTELSELELSAVISSLSMTIASIDTAEQKDIYLKLYNKLTNR